MAKITLQGNDINTIGNLPGVGTKAPDFTLVGSDLADVSLKGFSQTYKILNIVPSLDTPVCATSTKKFSELANKDVVIINISKDLPFAQKRFCSQEGIDNVVTLSAFRDKHFGKEYGVEIVDGPLANLLSRAVVVLGKDNKVLYIEQVPEITQEPDYDKAISFVG